MRLYPCLGIALSMLAAGLAWGAVEFSGYLRSSDRIQFVIMEPLSGETSGWITVGDSFQGHRITGFDAKRKVLTVEHAGKLVELPLKDSKVKHGQQTASDRTYLRLDLTDEGGLVIDGKAVEVSSLEAVFRGYAQKGIQT